MKVQPKYTGNVIPFQPRSENARDPTDDVRSDSITSMLDLSKFEQPRPAPERDTNMRANIVAMVLLGLIVFIAKEDFSRLERLNLCSTKSECLN
jgi:hypothetical protein